MLLLGAMNFNRPLREVLKISLFSGTLACIVVLTFHIHFKTPCVTENSKQTETVYNSYYPDISSGSSTLLPVMDFKELESKRKLLLLIIVSTAPRRFKRRQAIRDTWWKHCIGSQVKKKLVSNMVLKTSELFITYHMLKKKSSHQVEVQESVDKAAKQFFPPNLFDARCQVKYNVQPDWFDQIITVYLIGQFRPRSEMLSYHFTGIIFSHGFITLISTHNM